MRLPSPNPPFSVETEVCWSVSVGNERLSKLGYGVRVSCRVGNFESGERSGC